MNGEKRHAGETANGCGRARCALAMGEYWAERFERASRAGRPAEWFTLAALAAYAVAVALKIGGVL